MPTLEDLLARREQLRAELAKVESEIQVAQVGRRNEGIAMIQELMAQFELTTVRISAIVDTRFSLIVDAVSASSWTRRGGAQVLG